MTPELEENSSNLEVKKTRKSLHNKVSQRPMKGLKNHITEVSEDVSSDD